jgi:beta-mannanase
MDKKYGRVQGYRKPVIIAEMDVYGGPEYQWKWISAALTATRNYPLLIAIIYFKRQGYARRLERKIW